MTAYSNISGRSDVEPADTSAASSMEPSAPPAYDARALIRHGSVAHIRLDDRLYTLRITRQGKLILTR
ncbi:MAG: hemin uptake protein HemP [Pseudomonadota bacterium]